MECPVLICRNKGLRPGREEGRKENWGFLGTYYVPVALLGVIIKCFVVCLFVFVLAAPCSLWGLSSLARDRTLGSESPKRKS